MKQKKNRSLRTSFAAMVMLCWVLPVVLLVGLSGLYITKLVSEQTKNTAITSGKNAISGVQREMNEAIDASLSISRDPTLSSAWREYRLTGDDVEFSDTVFNYLNAHYKNNTRFLATYMVLLQEQDKKYSVYNTNIHTYSDILDFWKNDSEELIKYSVSIDTQVGVMSVDDKMFLVRNIVDASFSKYAVFIIELDTNAVFADLKNIVWLQEGCVWLNDTAIYNLGLSNVDNIKKPTKNEIKYGYFDEKLSVYGSTIQQFYDLSFVANINSFLVDSQWNSVWLVLVGIIALLLPMLTYLFYFFHKRITKPLNKLGVAAEQIESGNFGLQIDAKALNGKELEELGLGFNNMSRHLKKQFEQIYSEELALRDAKIMALQSQINPHFLNNTLEIINWEARIEGDIKVCRMIEALSTMLSAAMDRKHRPLVHLSEEMMYVDSYLYIIRERLGKRLEIVKEIDDDTLDCNVPRLILQPIIENAVEHGISPNNYGTIYIRAYIKDARLYLEIENNGECTKEDLDKIVELLSDNLPADGIGSTSLGIRNVHQRLRILYGNDSGLLVKLTKEGNVMSQISIKIEQDDQ